MYNEMTPKGHDLAPIPAAGDHTYLWCVKCLMVYDYEKEVWYSRPEDGQVELPEEPTCPHHAING